jgi:hypothetical protein
MNNVKDYPLVSFGEYKNDTVDLYGGLDSMPNNHLLEEIASLFPLPPEISTKKPVIIYAAMDEDQIPEIPRKSRKEVEDEPETVRPSLTPRRNPSRSRRSPDYLNKDDFIYDKPKHKIMTPKDQEDEDVYVNRDEQEQVVHVLMTQSNPDTTKSDEAEGTKEVTTGEATTATELPMVPPPAADVTKQPPPPTDQGIQAAGGEGNKVPDMVGPPTPIVGDGGDNIDAGAASNTGPPAQKIISNPKEEQRKGGAIKKHSSKLSNSNTNLLTLTAVLASYLQPLKLMKETSSMTNFSTEIAPP